MSKGVVDLARAFDFAARKHSGQQRKGAASEPYINHPADVARIVAEATAGGDLVLVLGALHHDTIEDTETTQDELVREFGPEVASLVAELTDDKKLDKAERKRLQVKNAPHKTPRAKLIKIADKTSNLRAILATPPVDWDLTGKREYFEWATKVVAGCRGINRALDSQFDEAYQAGLASGFGASPSSL